MSISETGIIHIIQQLLEYGEQIGSFLPWHKSRDPYHWTVAEILLRRTTRTAVSKAFSSLIATVPNWENLAHTPIEEIAAHISWVGLGKQRSTQLQALGKAVLETHNGVLPDNRESLMALPGIGNYVADAILLHAFSEMYFPIDPNFQRVIRRVIGLPTSIGTRHSEPYKDPRALRASAIILESYAVEDVQAIHRGALYLSWVNCRPVPKCTGCIFESNCSFRKKTA